MVVDSLAHNRQRLLQFLNTEMEPLNGILRVYLLRAGLPSGDDTLNELLNNMVVEALSHAQNFNPERPPRAWLLGIAANLVRRRQTAAARLNQREPLAADLTVGGELLGEDELFERLATQAADSAPADLSVDVENRDKLTACLGLLAVEERKLILLFASNHLDGEALAAHLEVSHGAARVRLHRALSHLRRVWFLSEETKDHD